MSSGGKGEMNAMTFSASQSADSTRLLQISVIVGCSQNLAKKISKSLGRERLGQLTSNPQVLQLIHSAGIRIRGDDYDRNLLHRRVGLHPLGHLQAAHDRHVQVGQNQVDL